MNLRFWHKSGLPFCLRYRLAIPHRCLRVRTKLWDDIPYRHTKTTELLIFDKTLFSCRTRLVFANRAWFESEAQVFIHGCPSLGCLSTLSKPLRAWIVRAILFLVISDTHTVGRLFGSCLLVILTRTWYHTPPSFASKNYKCCCLS